MRKALPFLICLLVMSLSAVAFAGGGDYPPIGMSLGGKTLAFAAIPAGSTAPIHQIFLWQYTRVPIQITHSPYVVLHPRFSPNGRELAVNDGNRVAVIDLKSGQEQIIVQGPRKFLGDWSPDGRYLCYTRYYWNDEIEDYDHPRVWIVNRQSGKTVQIPDNGLDQRNPSWGPNGEIAYEEMSAWGQPSIRGYNPYTGIDRELVPVDGPNGACFPVWTPDGNLLYGNYMYPNIDDDYGTIYLVSQFPGRGIQIVHNYYRYGQDVPEIMTPEGDLFYYSRGDSVYSTYHFFRDRFGTLWGLDRVIRMEYQAGSIDITTRLPLHDRWWSKPKNYRQR